MHICSKPGFTSINKKYCQILYYDSRVLVYLGAGLRRVCGKFIASIRPLADSVANIVREPVGLCGCWMS